MSPPAAVSNYLSTMEGLFRLTHADERKPMKRADAAAMRSRLEKTIAELGDASFEIKDDHTVSIGPTAAPNPAGVMLRARDLLEHPNAIDPDPKVEAAKSDIKSALSSLKPGEQKRVLRAVHARFKTLDAAKAQLAELDQADARVAALESNLNGADRELAELIGEIHRRTWAHMRNARIIDVAAAEFVGMQRAIAKYGAAEPHKPVAGVPYPERTPFSDTYFSFGDGVSVELENAASGILCGILVTPALAVGLMRAVKVAPAADNPDPHLVLVECWYNDGKWREEFWLPHAQALLIALVDLVNNYRSFVLEQEPTASERIKYRQLAKRFVVRRPIPQPYYTIRLKTKVVHTSVYRTARRLAQYSIEFSHRFDVRGHERCKIQRGKLPIDPKTEKILERRGYKLFGAGQPPEHVCALLQSRGIPLRGGGEWLAVKVFWVSEHIKGPEDKPYVPAVRVTATATEKEATAHEPDE